MQIETLGVIGAGTMGNGIAQVCAMAGLKVVMLDISEAALQRGMQNIGSSLDRLLRKEQLDEAGKQATLDRIQATTDRQALSQVDLLIEAATEAPELKEKILADVCSVLKPQALIASNTSSISITRLAAATDRPDRFIGMHFFNPVPMINEAVFVLQEGLASAEDIDTGMRLGCSHPIGPLALADLIGLDTLLAVMEVFYQSFNDSKYRPAPLLREMVEAGYLGRKSGRGFYSYS